MLYYLELQSLSCSLATLLVDAHIGTAFTLFVVPSIYVLVARTHRADTRATEDEASDLEPVTA